ncbi:Interleukin-like EMT inducer [Hymenobacter daecheongensis DSM 21074]|uniref:Interleukin-like EMT inducer n=2 Tax=Hymenobacter daecheongensis TaxID=496053 RepID=A0A1M6F091_9BACT|nr:Interleukin-like EMT inducer [Hymenobacter daecheongensis DSM 21074]
MLRQGLLLVLLLCVGQAAQAQSGQYGNEWIVPAQQYYKIKVTRDGLHRLDYNYLTRAGINSADPTRFQLWRRGREVAIYVGGNSPTTLDASTFIEFYGQRNDGALDVGMYKNDSDHYQKLYSLYTDTAAYFLTIASPAISPKRMQQVNPTPVGGAHPYWRYQRTEIHTFRYNDVDLQSYVFQPWGEPGEGFFSGPFRTLSFSRDSLLDNGSTGPVPQIELQLVGSSKSSHRVTLYSLPPGGAPRRAMGPAVDFNAYEQRKMSYPLLRTDIDANGVANFFLEIDTQPTGTATNLIRVGYTKITHTRPSTWNASRSMVRFANDSTLGSAPAYYSLGNVPATVRGFDVTDPYNVQRVEGRAESAGRRGYVFPNAVPGGRSRNLWLVDVEKAILPPPATRVQFSPIGPANYNFLIVSSTRLMRPAGTIANPVQAYANYRASAAGGSHQPLIVTSEQLYDQFHYGEKSALAIRNFALYMLTNTRPKSLLLLGKGLAPGEYDEGVYHRQFPDVYRAPGGPNVRDLVPTSLRGPSDIFLTADWRNSSSAARMATGRISAQTPADVASYLKKLQEYEEVISRPDAPGLEWRKNALHIAGGKNEAEFEEFGNNLNEYKRRIEQPLFAGRVIKTYARTDAGLPQGLSIANELNAGLALINYFGHGDPTSLDFDLGRPADASSGYNNAGKYPVMFALGCGAGNDFRARRAQFPEDWLLVPDKGLIGFMSESSFGFEPELHEIQDETFKLLLNDPQWYSKPVAEIQNEVARRLGPQASYSQQGSLMSTIWHADPALRLFAPAQPDFTFGTPALEIQPVGTGPVLATSSQFRLLVKVRNPGKVTYDRVDISVKREYDRGSLPVRADTVYTFNGLRQALRDTTYVLTLRNTGSPFGTNNFTVTLDYQNRVAELNELNNTATTSFVFLRPGVTLLSPPEFAIANSETLRLVGQTNVAGPIRPFDLELDTIPTFNSPLLRRTTVQAPLVAEWRPRQLAIAGRDSVVWYWRMRFKTKLDASENDDWTTSSFRIINDGTTGWSQSHHGQFRRDELQRLSVAAPSGKWKFEDVTKSIMLRTQGAAPTGTTFQGTYGVQLGTEQLSVLACGVTLPNILVSVLDGASFKSLRKLGGGPYDSCGTAPNRFYHFAASATDNINSPARQQQLLTLLNNVPAGAYVALVSANRVNFSAFPPALKAALTALGAQKVNQLQDGDPYVLLAQKGAGSQTQERTYDAAQPGTRTEQIVSLTAALNSNSASGSLSSTLIGPAQQWTTLHHTVRTEPSDSYSLQLIGVDANKVETVLQPNVTSRAYSLAGVSAAQYPYLKLQLRLRDTLNRTAPQIEQLLVTYKGFPEGVARRDSVLARTPNAYDAATLKAQAATGYLRVPVVFQNVTPITFGTPLKARITVRSTGGTTTAERVTEMTLPNVGANGALLFTAPADVRDLSGDISMQVDVNMDKAGLRQPELFYFNNVLTLPAFRMDNANLPPVLDVAFDGRRILNGDIVSPRPVITVLMTDDNRLRPISRANAFDVVLIRPDGTQTRVDLLRDTNISFVADSTKGTAELKYEPGKTSALLDGTYRLEVQGRDANNTQATVGDKYSITFEVISTSSITHLYPYPNPITSKAKFVFTLTGSEMPRNFKIQIMTLTGKVVKQIMMDDLGPLHIGNNITEYAWDGTDDYQDRLANGTYLYRVVMDDPENKFERRKTAGDKSFKNEWGKLVLLR